MFGRSCVALLLLAAATGETCPGNSNKALPSAKLAARIELALHGDYAPLDENVPVLGLVYVGPEEYGPGSAGLRPVPDGVLPPRAVRPEHPSDALREPGYYVGTFTEDNHPRFLARLGGRSAVLGEGAVNGELSAVLAEPDAVVLAGRIPFLKDDYVVVFDTRDGKVTQVRWSRDLDQKLPPWPAPRLGRRVAP